MRPAYVIMKLRDALVLSKRQAINIHPTDSYVIIG